MNYLITKSVVSQSRWYPRMLCTKQFHQIVGSMKPLFYHNSKIDK